MSPSSEYTSPSRRDERSPGDRRRAQPSAHAPAHDGLQEAIAGVHEAEAKKDAAALLGHAIMALRRATAQEPWTD